MQKTIMLICGFPGIGKTTLCKKLDSRIPDAYFLDADKFFVKKGDMPSNYAELSEEDLSKRRERYISLKTEEIEQLLGLHDIVIVDGLFTCKRERNIITCLAQKKNIRLIIIRVVCPEDIAKERILNHKSHLLEPEKRWETHMKTKDRWEDIEEEHIKVDSSKEIDYKRIFAEIEK